MADNYLSKTGLAYFYDRIKRLFVSQDDFDDLSDAVDRIVQDGGEPNVIETIQRNGTALPVSGKTVNISVPTKTSDLTNDGDGTSNFATEAYVNTNGGKIDKIQVNGTEQTITNKTVNVAVPTKTSDITNDSNYVSDANYVHTDSNFTSAEKTKLSNIAAGAEVNVQSDWKQATTTADDFIKNKPTKLSEFTNDSGFIASTDKGAANGIASLDANGKVPTAQLPSYVDDVLEAYPRSGQTELTSGWLSSTSGGAALTPETGKIYVLMAASTNYAANTTFRWSGSTYVKLSDAGLSAITTAEIDTIVDGT